MHTALVNHCLQATIGASVIKIIQATTVTRRLTTARTIRVKMVRAVWTVLKHSLVCALMAGRASFAHRILMNAAPILVEIMVPVLTLLTVLFANALNLGKGDCADHKLHIAMAILAKMEVFARTQGTIFSVPVRMVLQDKFAK